MVDAVSVPEGTWDVAWQPLIFLDIAAHQGGIAFSRHNSMLAVGGQQLLTVFDVRRRSIEPAVLVSKSVVNRTRGSRALLTCP